MAMNIKLWHTHSQCMTYKLFPVDSYFFIPHLLHLHIFPVIYSRSVVTYYLCIILFIHRESRLIELLDLIFTN